MRRLEIKLSLPAVRPLLARLEVLRPRLGEALANPVVRGIDEPDFRELMAGDLLAGQDSDLELFFGLFGPEFQEGGLLVIEESDFTSVLRASSALRLALRERQLEFLTDADLETGDVPLGRFSAPQRASYAAYLLLATLQEIVIEHLDPGAQTPPGEDE